VYFGKSKTIGREALVKLRRKMEMQTGIKMKYIKSDGGQELRDKHLDKWLAKRGITRVLTAPGCSAGQAETYIGKIQRMGKANENQAAALPEGQFRDWAERHAAQMIELVPQQDRRGRCMYGRRTGRSPADRRAKMHAFGCLATARKTTQTPRGSNPATPCFHLCRSLNDSDGWIFWDPATRHLFTSRSAAFFDDRFAMVEYKALRDRNPSALEEKATRLTLGPNKFAPLADAGAGGEETPGAVGDAGGKAAEDGSSIGRRGAGGATCWSGTAAEAFWRRHARPAAGSCEAEWTEAQP